MKKIQKETKRHADAFAYYLRLGRGRRSYIEVARKFQVSHTTVAKWSKSFNWLDKVKEYDKKIIEETKKKAVALICDDKNRLLEAKSKLVERAISLAHNPKATTYDAKEAWKIIKTELGEPTNISTNNIKSGDENPFSTLFLRFFGNEAKND